MRVLRRITGQVRYDCHHNLSDYDVRLAAGQPSIDCIVQRMRLRYLRRLLDGHAPDLCAVLSTKTCDEKSLPWVELVLDDLRLLQSNVLSRSAFLLPDPASDPGKWTCFIVGCGNLWGQLVDHFLC